MPKTTEKYLENKTKDKFIQVQCTECERETRHKIIQSLDYEGSEVFEYEQYSIEWSTNYQIIQCQGCLTPSFRKLDWFSEHVQQIGPDEWDDGSTEILFPKRTQHTIPTKELWNVPTNLRRIYREIIECFNIDAFTMCAAGLRGLVEGLCAELNVKNGPKEITEKDGSTKIIRVSNLEGKIAGLFEKGFLTEQHANILHEHRYMGNEAVHELAQPSRDELALAVDIIEHIFESVYEIPQKAQDLKTKRTKRRKN